MAELKQQYNLNAGLMKFQQKSYKTPGVYIEEAEKDPPPPPPPPPPPVTENAGPPPVAARVTDVPTRPVFQDCERLTAARLNEAIDYLRLNQQRLAMAPLSAGIAAGLEMDPRGIDVAQWSQTRQEGDDGKITIKRGVAIDGHGRLLVLREEQVFDKARIDSMVDNWETTTHWIQVRLVYSGTDADPTNACSPHQPRNVVDGATIVLKPVTTAETNVNYLNAVTNPNCVPAWSNLDDQPADGDDCGVTIGHILYVPTTFQTDTLRIPKGLMAIGIKRQGVSPRFGTIRNSYGTPAISLTEVRGNLGAGETDVDIAAFHPLSAFMDDVYFMKQAKFAQPVRFEHPVENLSSADFATGKSSMPALLSPSSAPIGGSGWPLALDEVGGIPMVKSAAHTPPSSDTIIGLSARASAPANGSTAPVERAHANRWWRVHAI